MTHSFPLGYSPYPPVSVYGTDSIEIILEDFLESVLNQLAAVKPQLTSLLEFAIKCTNADLPTSDP
jgi:hypothetical protein